MDKKKACLEDEKRFEFNLRVSIERLLLSAHTNLCTGTSYRVIPAIKRYQDKREQMKRTGLPEDDIKRYDDRFRGLPWELAGMQAPQFDY